MTGTIHWSVVAGAETLAPRQRMRVTVSGEEQVLWRSAEGRLHAFGNRCPHRGMRLSFGVVRGEELLCMYHGWRYGSNGRCAAIPAHPDLTPPPTIRAEVRGCIEQDGLVYVARGMGDEGSPPLLDGGAGTAFRYCRTVYVDCPVGSLEATMTASKPLDASFDGRHLLNHHDGCEEAIFIYREPESGTTVALASQVIDRSVTAIHATVSSGPDRRLELARWLETFRDQATDVIGKAA